MSSPIALGAAERVPVRWVNWGGRAVFAVLDQGFFAGSNFIVNILLARWLTPESFGTFAVAYSLLFLLGTFYTQILTAPMLVFGASKEAGDFRRYLGFLLHGHFGIAAAISLVAMVAAGILGLLGSAPLARGLVGLGIAAPFILFLWFVRTAFYVRLKPQWAAAGSALNLLLVVSGIYVLHRLDRLSPGSGLLVMGSSSLVVGTWLVAVLRPCWRDSGLWSKSWWTSLGPSQLGFARLVFRPPLEGRLASEGLAIVLHDHFRYAKWSWAASATGWVVGNLHYFVLSATAGLGSVAAMRVLDTALSPYFQFQLAISRLLVPVFGARSKSPGSDLLLFVTRLSVLWGVQAILAYLLVRSFAPKAISMLYGGAYIRYSPLLVWYGLVMIPMAVCDPLLSLLAALVRTDLIFLYQLVFSAALLGGYLIAARHGLSGIILVVIVVSYSMVPVVVVSAKAACARLRMAPVV